MLLCVVHADSARETNGRQQGGTQSCVSDDIYVRALLGQIQADQTRTQLGLDANTNQQTFIK